MCCELNERYSNEQHEKIIKNMCRECGAVIYGCGASWPVVLLFGVLQAVAVERLQPAHGEQETGVRQDRDQ